MSSITEKEKISLEKIEISKDETHHLYEGMPLYEKRFDCVLSFHPPGVAAVIDNTGAYHITFEGDPQYEERFIKSFGVYEGIAAVVDNSGWYHIGLNGKPKYEKRYEWVGNFQEGRCPVRDIGGDFFHIKKDGSLVYNEKYKYVGDYKYGFAVVYGYDGFARHIDKFGNFLHEKKFIELGIFHKGFATAKDNRGAFHINKNGDALYQERYKWIEPFYNGFALVGKHNREKLIIDEQGKTIHKIDNQNSHNIQSFLRHKLMRMLVGYWKTQIIHSIVELEILDHIRNNKYNFKKLLETTNLPYSSLKLIIQLLKIWDFIEEIHGVYKLKYLGNLLTEEYPETLKYAAKMWGEEHYLAMTKLTEALKTNKPQFKEIFGKEIFDFFDIYEDKRLIFNKSMKAYSSDYDKIIDLYDFTNAKVIADIGGGTGYLLEKILLKNQHIQKGILFERASVIESVKNFAHIDSIRKKIEYIPGDFFRNIPFKADVIIMSRVIHDWDDGKAGTILKTVNSALEQNGKLLLFEMIIPEDPNFDIGVSLNFNLLVSVGGKERNYREFKDLLQKSGFKINTIKKNEGIISLIIAEKIKDEKLEMNV